ncbi:hypothetical protein B0A48_17156 [Cryoendolithus antarcticus]|uniref:Uncharacterized protein n=1 Tax=Cryoendolithus antarcticus TaxID=1507870 RepID=A0A1V8SC69_9PEZI|nr:hypothetical protein B0A48_17156 [Cryoendolithus antarcticus]
MSGPIILYDLPSRTGTCWSLNPWKTRAALNFKALPYTTEWTEYPDLEPKFKSFSIPPNPAGSLAAYSSPAVRMPDGTYIMDSRAIADALEKLHPEPSLHLESECVEKVQKLVLELWDALRPIAMPRIPTTVLSPASAEYFERTRAVRFGMTLTELGKSDQAGPKAWENARSGIAAMKAVLEEHKGPYVLGKEASYGDLIWAGFWHMMSRLSEDRDLIEGFRKQGGDVFDRHFDACKQWYEKDT